MIHLDNSIIRTVSLKYWQLGQYSFIKINETWLIKGLNVPFVTYLCIGYSIPHKYVPVHFHLAIKCGLRQGELLGLKWSDLDWKKSALHIHRQYQSIRVGDEFGFFKTPKSDSGSRTIKLGNEILLVLQTHFQNQLIEKTEAGDFWNESNLMFPRLDGSPTSARWILDEFEANVQATGAKKIRFHDLRHTAASLMILNGIPILIVSRILGHKDPSITLKMYSHISFEDQEKAANLMDRLFNQGQDQQSFFDPSASVPQEYYINRF